MNASGSGDIVTVLDMDIQPFKIGMQTAGKDVKAFGDKMSGDMGRALGQMGFAAQDFSSVLSMGGKNALGRAMMSTMNNVQVLGQAFGPWGMAITSVGGALGSILIPKLFEASAASEEFANQLKTAREESDKAAKTFASATQFQARAEKIDKPDQGNAMIDDIKVQRKIAEDERTRLEKLKTTVTERLAKPEEMERKWYSMGKSNVQKDWDERVAAQKELEELNKKLDENRTKRSELSAHQGLAEQKTGEAVASEAFTAAQKKAHERDTQKMKAEMAMQKQQDDAFAAAQKENEKRDEQRRHTAESIAHGAETPFETAQRKLEELNQHLAAGTISPELHDKAAAKLIGDYGKTQTDQKLAGGQAGSSSAFEQIRESIKAAKNPADDEKIALLKRQADGTDAFNKKMDKIVDAPPLRVEGIS